MITPLSASTHAVRPPHRALPLFPLVFTTGSVDVETGVPLGGKIPVLESTRAPLAKQKEGTTGTASTSTATAAPDDDGVGDGGDGDDAGDPEHGGCVRNTSFMPRHAKSEVRKYCRVRRRQHSTGRRQSQF